MMVKMSQVGSHCHHVFLSRAQNWSFLEDYDPMVRQTMFPSDMLALGVFIHPSHVY